MRTKMKICCTLNIIKKGDYHHMKSFRHNAQKNRAHQKVGKAGVSRLQKKVDFFSYNITYCISRCI